jgi:site-specific DNA recombinase
MSSVPPIRGVAYYRMSTGQQEASIPEQSDWAQKAAKANAVEIVHQFQDAAIAGGEIEQRAGLMDMLAYCENPPGGRPIEALVVWDPDRLSRANSIRTAAVIDRLMTAGVCRLLAQEGWLDFENDIDRLLFNIKQDMGREAYSKSLSRNVARSGLSRAKEGRWVAGKPPYAYIVGPEGKLIFGSKAEVQALRWMFHQYITTADSLGDLARKLTNRGAPPPRPGGEWTRYTVREMLLNRAYTGDLVWNANTRGKYHCIREDAVKAVKRRSRNHSKKANDLDDVVIVKDAHPALVDRDTFAAVPRKMSENRWKRTTPLPGGGTWLLSGLLHCGDCGTRMIGHTDRMHRGDRTYTYRRYICHGNVKFGPGTCWRNAAKEEVVLREVATLIRESFTSPKRLAELRAEVDALAREEEGNSAADRKRLVERIEELDRLIDQGTVRLLTVAKDMMDGAASKVREWQDERKRLATDLARRETASAHGDQFLANVSEAMEQLKRLEEVIMDAPPEDVRTVLSRLVRKITLNFEHGPKLAGGKKERNTLSTVDVELHPDANYLLGTANNTRSRT